MSGDAITRPEVCAVACAELFRDAGEIMVSPMANMVSIGARLARLTFSPDILLTDGEARLLADTPALGATGASVGSSGTSIGAIRGAAPSAVPEIISSFIRLNIVWLRPTM